jgi:YHS domain-containing protein
MLMFASIGQAADSAAAINRNCPVEPGKKAHEKYQLEHLGKRIIFCCEECLEEFKRSPQTYLPSIPGDSPGNADHAGKSRIQSLFDSVWNTATATAGLTIGTLLLLLLLCFRYTSSRFAPQSQFTRISQALTSRKSIAGWLVFLCGGEAIFAHLAHHHTRAGISDSELEHAIHYTTFSEYGDPPLPSRSPLPPRVKGHFYRGNDERSPELFNGGHYRTATFELDLCSSDGGSITHGDQVNFENLFVRVRFRRAAGTPDYFWLPNRMSLIYATRDPGKFHWRQGPVDGLVEIKEAIPMQEWMFRYPIAAFTKGQDDNSVAGTFYLCEKRFNDSESIIGGRFHCAFSFRLQKHDNQLAQSSDLWMGALYRKRSLRIWEIPESEWLSHEPIPEILKGESSSDPVLLGIRDYQENTN